MKSAASAALACISVPADPLTGKGDDQVPTFKNLSLKSHLISTTIRVQVLHTKDAAFLIKS